LHNREIPPRYVVIRNRPEPIGENTAMEPVDEAQRRSRSNGLCECLPLALMLYSLAPGSASAGDQPPSANARRNIETQKAALAQINAASFPAPFSLYAPAAELPGFSATDFRPRKAALLAAATARNESSFMDAPMLGDTSIARELSDAKTQDRVRLLTLWQSRASSLSLQAGKRGAPSLQWSTPWMHRDAAARGLFDRLLLAAPRSFGSAIRGGGSRPASAIAAAKPADLDAPSSNK
jgi:hypothetical protein